MRLGDLIGESDVTSPGGETENGTEIVGLACDSRKVRPGYLFAALPGTRVDGAIFARDAIARGAAAILTAPGVEFDGLGGDVPVIADAEPRRRYAKLAARFFAEQPRTIALVTGTNGKTSVAEFTRRLWTSAGRKAGSLGTIGLKAPGFEGAPGLTTPDAADLHRTLRDLSDAGVDHLCVRASSHGLSQYRLDGLRVRAAAFTNLSRDHLDYHKDMENYFRAKSRLFGDILAPGGWAVLNADSDRFDALAGICVDRGHRVFGLWPRGRGSSSFEPGSDADGSVPRHGLRGTPLPCRSSLDRRLSGLERSRGPGPFPGDRRRDRGGGRGLSLLRGAPGRMEHIGETLTGGHVYVDYAHAPDALRTALLALRTHARNNLSVVFGCGGDRDRGKRSEMGAVAKVCADRVIVTDDNPAARTRLLFAAIMEACDGAVEIADREAAIVQAIRDLGEGDILVIAGKGHEQGQIVESGLAFR